MTASTLAAHYSAILSDLQHRREMALAALRELETDIERITRLASQIAPLNADSMSEEKTNNSGPVPVREETQLGKPISRPDFSKMSVRWAVLWLLSDCERRPLRTSEIANALIEGGYKSGSDSFLNAVSAVLSGMKAKGEIETTADGYVVTERGRHNWSMIRQGGRFRLATSPNERSLLSVQ